MDVRLRFFIGATIALAAPLMAQQPAPSPLDGMEAAIGTLADPPQPATTPPIDVPDTPDSEGFAPPEPPPPPPPPDAPSLFGTVAVLAPDSHLASRWRAVRDNGANGPQLQRIAATVAGLSHGQQLGFVQAEVNRTIPYRDDRRWWGEDDYWATADQTLSRHGGDCEDLAIVKYQLLRRLGFDPKTLYLSIGRDVSRGDHALLLVHDDGQWWVLDDRFSRPVRAGGFTSFQPIITFAQDSSFIHGRALKGSP